MPYKFEKKEPFNLLPCSDSRVKITQILRNKIISEYEQGTSQRAIARATGVSRRMISFIIHPEREAKCKEQFKERRKDGRYYDKENHRKAMKATRNKKALIQKGKKL